MSAFFKIKSYLRYWLGSVDEHSLHGPFLFNFYTQVIRKETTPIPTIESLRKELLGNHNELAFHDPGAGSKYSKGNTRKISDIAMYSLSPVKFSSLYLRIARHLNSKTIIELGTSLGINTLYLAAQPDCRVYTFEGSAPVAELATRTFAAAGVNNIELIQGNLDDTLRSALTSLPEFDLAFIDANHRFAPTLRYFELLLSKVHRKSIIIIDDIHDSPEMQQAWNEIRTHPVVCTSVDLFRCGLLFFDPGLNRQHVVLRF